MTQNKGVKKTSHRCVFDHAGRRGGFVTLADLIQCGLTRGEIQVWTRNGRLVRVWHGVYALGHVPRDPRTASFGAVLAAGPGAALAGDSAGAFYGALWSWPERPQLVSPRRCRVRGIAVQYAQTLKGRDVWRHDGLAVTSPARTALDLAAHHSEERLKSMVDHLRLTRGQRLTLHQLEDILVRNPRHPGVSALAHLLHHAPRRPRRSNLERTTWPAFAAAHGLPGYEQNVIVAGHEVDVLVAGCVVVEIDTFGTHLLNFESDRARDREIVATTGMPVLRVTDVQLTEDPQTAAEQILATVAREQGRL